MEQAVLILISSLTEAVFSWLVQTTGDTSLGEKVQKLLSADPPRRAFQKSLAVTYAALSRNFPEWTASFFDEHFLIRNEEVSRELAKILSRDQAASAEQLAQQWGKQFHVAPSDSNTELIKVASYFISVLTIECRAQQALQPFFDSKAFERLHELADTNAKQLDVLTEIKSLITEGNMYLRGSTLPGEHAQTSEAKWVHKLPPRAPSFIGRNKELSSILSHLNPDSRSWLIAVEGVGGIGKTSLVLEAAHLCKEQEFFDLIVWTTAQERFLTERTIEEIEPEIEVLDDILELVARHAGQPISDLNPLDKKKAVLNILSSIRCLLIVDNFETVRDDAISQFLRFQIPSPSKSIVTCRLRLQTGESIPLTGMSLIESRVFIRKIAESRNVKIEESSAEEIMYKIWEWSGGVPLAMRWVIGRASSGLTGLSRLIQGLPDLSNGELLQFCFDEVYKQLKAVEQITLQALTIFRSPISKEAIAAVSDVHGIILNEATKSLWEKSLVEYDSENERFGLLPLTRKYARSKAKGVDYLAIGGFFERAISYFKELVKKYSHDYERLELDLDNIFVVLDWCISQKRSRETLEMVTHITWYLGIRGMSTERLRYAEAAVEAALDLGLEEDALWIKAFDVGWVTLNRGLYDETLELYNQLLLTSVEKGYSKVAALSLRNIALLKRRLFMEASDKAEDSTYLLQEASAHAKESLKLWQEVGDEYWIAISYGTLGTIAMQQGNHDYAREQYQKAMELDRKNNNDEGIALATSNLGRIAIKLGDYEEALKLIDEAMAIDKNLRREQGIASGLQRKAYVYDRLDRLQEALECLKEASVIYRKIGSIPRFNVVQNQISLLERKLKGETNELLF